MGAYIINIPDSVDRVVYTNVDPMNGKTYIASYSVDDLTPYTAPDLEQVRKEAYKDGYNVGFGKKIYTSYQEGLSDAWEAARKICLNDSDGGLTIAEIAKIFDVSYYRDAMKKYSAHEAIEKIRQYEQEKEMDGLRQNIQTIVDKCGYSLDEIAAVLEKMKE